MIFLLLSRSPGFRTPIAKPKTLYNDRIHKNKKLLGQGYNININAIMPAAFTRLTGLLQQGQFRNHLEKDFQPEKLAPVIAYLRHKKCDVAGESSRLVVVNFPGS